MESRGVKRARQDDLSPNSAPPAPFAGPFASPQGRALISTQGSDGVPHTLDAVQGELQRLYALLHQEQESGKALRTQLRVLQERVRDLKFFDFD